MAKQLPDTTRIFLADGDALNLSTDYVIQILEYLYKISKIRTSVLLCDANEFAQKNSRRIEKNEYGWS